MPVRWLLFLLILLVAELLPHASAKESKKRRKSDEQEIQTPLEIENTREIAKTYLGQGSVAEALQCLLAEHQRLSKLDLQDVALSNAYSGLLADIGSIYYYNQSQWDEAIEFFSKASKLAPDNYETLFRLGNAYLRKGRFKPAHKAYSSALAVLDAKRKQNPSQHRAHTFHLPCPANCSAHGLCNPDGSCHCDPGFSGADCSTTTDIDALLLEENSAVRFNAVFDVVLEGGIYSVHSISTLNRQLLRRLHSLYGTGQYPALRLRYIDRDLRFSSKDESEWTTDREEQYIAELQRTAIEREPWIAEISPLRVPIAASGMRELMAPPGVWIRSIWPPLLDPPLLATARWVWIQPWEYGRVPLEWTDAIHQRHIDEVWAVSEANRQMFIRDGLVPPDKVAVVPCGVDVEIYRPYPGGRAAAESAFRQFAESRASEFAEFIHFGFSKTVRFLFVGGTLPRKGFDILIYAYAHAFTANDDVCLIVKDTGSHTFYVNEARGAEVISNMRKNMSERAPCVAYVDVDIPATAMSALYGSANAIVAPYRGEGFGLPIAEAMACGIPAIVPRGGPAMEYTTNETAYYVATEELEWPIDAVGTMQLAGRVSMLEPDGRDLAAVMKEVVSDPERAAKKGAKAAEYIRTHVTWEVTAKKAMERLRILRGRPVERKTPLAVFG